MDIRAEDISKIIREQIGNYAVDVDVAEVGTVISIGDGISACTELSARWRAKCSSSRTACSALR